MALDISEEAGKISFESSNTSQLVVWLILFGSVAVLANGLLFGLMWRRVGARSLLYRTLILFDGLYGLTCTFVVMMFYGPLADCNTVAYNLTTREVASKEDAVITDEMRGAGCVVGGLPLDIAAFFVTVTSRVPSAVLMALAVTWIYKILVGKPCRLLAILPIIIWTVFWCLMALASLATILHFTIRFKYPEAGITYVTEDITRRDSLFRILTNNPLPNGADFNTELVNSEYLLTLVFSFQIPLLLAAIGGIIAAVLGYMRKESIKGGSCAIHIAVMTTFSLVMSGPMFIYIVSGWRKLDQTDNQYNPDTYQVFVYTVLLPLVAAAVRAVIQLSCRTWQKNQCNGQEKRGFANCGYGSTKKAGITIENDNAIGMSQIDP